MNKMCGDICGEKDQATIELEGLRSQQELLRTDRIRSTEDLAYWQGQHKGASDAFYEMQQRLLAKGGTLNFLIYFFVVQGICISSI